VIQAPNLAQMYINMLRTFSDIKPLEILSLCPPYRFAILLYYQLYAVVYLKPKQLIIKDCARRFVLKLYRHEASRGLFATAELLVLIGIISTVCA